MNSLLDQMKHMGSSMVHQSKRTMLKTDILFLEREIKSRKQKFGVEVYELMETLESSTSSSNEHDVQELEQQIRQAFDAAKRDVFLAQEKINAKRQELDQNLSQNNQNIASPTNKGANLQSFSMDDDDEYGYET